MLDSSPCSAQVAAAELEGRHSHPLAQPLDVGLPEVVVLVVLDDDLLQLHDLLLHLGAQFSLHLQQSLEGGEAR